MTSFVSIRSGPELPSCDPGRGAGPDPADAAALEVEQSWGIGLKPSVEAIWAKYSPEGSVGVLAALIKADLRCRFERGERPDVADYLSRFEVLRSARDRVVSLVYEEYCLREERGEAPDPDEFCGRYDAWRDSLLSQLRYHRMLSQAVGAMPSTSRLPSAGERFRTFRLRSVLGQGGTARVFLAHDESLGDRVVALKVSSERGKEPAIQGRLDHAHIVPVLSVTDDSETGLRGLCMPYRAGLPLDEVIRRVDPGSRPRRAEVLRQALAGEREPGARDDTDNPSWQGFPARGTYAQGVAWIVAVVARALAYAHDQDVFHRDIKPANVLLTARDGPQLLDFNLAHSPHSADQAEAALRGGTLPYMAPEQLEAFLDPDRWNDVGKSADIYALGLLLRELLTGRRPEAPDPSIPLPRAIRDLLDRRLEGVAPARALNPDVPRGLDAILARCLASRPEARYASAVELAVDLERFVTHRPLLGAVNPSLRERAGNWAKRNQLGRIALICLAASVLTLATILFFHWMFAPSDGLYFAKLAEGNAQRGEWLEARKNIDIALGMKRDFYVHSVNAHVFFGEKKYQDADRAIDLALRLAEDDPKADDYDRRALLWHQKGEIALLRGDKEAAEAAYLAALGKARHFHGTAFQIATLAQERNDHARTKEYADWAILEAERLSERVDSATMASYHQLRAAAEVDLGNHVPRPAPVDGEAMPRLEPEYQLALDYFRAAERDLQVARTLQPSLLGDAAQRRDVISARVLMGFGDLASERNDYIRSIDYFEAARDLIAASIARWNESKPAANLAKLLDVRLATDLPKMPGL